MHSHFHTLYFVSFTITIRIYLTILSESPLEVRLIERHILQVVVSTVGLLFVGKLLEPIWGSREFLKFIFIVNFLTSLCVFITAIALYYITQEEIYL